METTDYLTTDGMLACFSIEIHDMNLMVIIFSKSSQNHMTQHPISMKEQWQM